MKMTPKSERIRRWIPVTLLAISLIGGILFWPFSAKIPPARILTAEDLIKDWYHPSNNLYQYVDVRSEKENKTVRIPNSQLVPLEDMKSTTPSLDKNKKIILYCTVGVRSRKAYALLSGMGYDNIYVLKGGAENMDQSSRPIGNT